MKFGGNAPSGPVRGGGGGGGGAWPGAVAYYLREHEVPPDPDLVAHIRARRFTPPSEVSAEATVLALAAITGERL